MEISDINYSGYYYPSSRRAFIARYNGTNYDIYRQTNFWSTNYVTTGQDIAEDDTQWVSYDGSERSDVKLKMPAFGGNTPEVNSELAVLLFPSFASENGVYNIGGGYSNGVPTNIVQLTLSGFTGLANGDNFTLYVHRGYAWRKFWNR